MNPLITRNFRIDPLGLVKDGMVQYTENTLTGELSYSGQITVGMWPFKKTYKTAGNYTVDPQMLRSSMVSQVGKQVTVGPVVFTVIQAGSAVAVVQMAVRGKPMRGTAYLDVSQEFFQVDRVDAQVDVPVVGTLAIRLRLLAATQN